MADDINQAIGRRVYMFRSAKGLSQTDLGAMIGKTKQAIHKIEAGSVQISAINAVLLAKALEVPIDDILPSRLRGDDKLTRRVVDLALALAPLDNKMVETILEKAVEQYETIS